MASYEKLNNELEQMKAKFMALSSEEEEREFRKEMEAFVASKPTEDREVLAKVFIDGATRACEQAEKVYDDTLRAYLDGIYESISWSYVARHYFGKSRSWLSQRINGLKIRNKEVQFTADEKKILLNALLDLSNNIKWSMLWNPFSITSLLPVRSYADGTQAACIIPFLSRYGSATLPPC